MATSILPHREPTSVISFTIGTAVSIETRPWTVDFMTTVPRGSVILIAVARPSLEPVESTVKRNSRSGVRLPVTSKSTLASRIFSGWRPKSFTCAP